MRATPKTRTPEKVKNDAPTLRMRAHGFTLVELMAVITIAAILLAIGVPSYRSITKTSRVTTEVNTLLGDMQFARSEALKRGQIVTTCISTDGASCTGGTAWQGGWIVFADIDGSASVDAADTVIRVQRALTGGDTFVEAGNRAAISFNRSGFALNLPAGGALLKLHDSTSTANYTRCLSISTTGMMATSKKTATCT